MASRRGLQHINLTTDRLNNDCANRFYQRMGFALLRSSTTPEGCEMNEYIIQLCPDITSMAPISTIELEKPESQTLI